MNVTTRTLTREEAEKRVTELIAGNEINKIYERKGSGALFQIKLIDAILKPNTEDEWEVTISAKDLNPILPIPQYCPCEERWFYGMHIPVK